MAPRLTPSSLLTLSVFQYLFEICVAANPPCVPSACGLITNISYPFRLKDDPFHCGDHRAELACENNVTSISLNSHKYYVSQINYAASGSTIRLVDASINNHFICSFPNYSLYKPHHFPYAYAEALPIHFISCPNPLNNSSLFTDITHCASNSSLPRFTYVKVGHIKASQVTQTCDLEVIVMTSWKFRDLNNVSLLEIHHSLLYGFELTFCYWCFSTKWEKLKLFFSKANKELLWIPLVFVVLVCAGVSFPLIIVIGFTGLLGLLFIVFRLTQKWTLSFDEADHETDTWALVTDLLAVAVDMLISGIIISAPKLIIACPYLVWLLIYKYQRRYLSRFDDIESFLQSDNKLAPIRYSYSDIKNMTKNFQDKLGEGGYGFVYKGKLRSGHHVAVKMLGKSGGNGRDFMNEIATIGRIHHVYVITLVGYCAQGSKRALVFDFMPNGSLDKYIFDREKMTSFTWDRKFDIAVGIARGIEYLHRGCDFQILHFDIKPHNILLDEKFIPKISDFGLAKFCSIDKKTVSMTTARGTVGYVAPELVSRSIGPVSYKADVYSFGMLLMGLLNLNRDLVSDNGDSSKYFPHWIYDSFNQGKDIDFGKANEIDNNDENGSRRKLARKMTIVALWCTQTSPRDRPSMNKVLEMLDGDVECLQLPLYPSHSTQIVDQTCSTTYVSSLSHHDALSCVEITVQEW